MGEDAKNLRMNRHRYPALVRFALDLAKEDALGQLARAGIELPQALIPYAAALLQTALEAPCSLPK
jgi:hypothetical protein